jgi:hypothetical protein
VFNSFFFIIFFIIFGAGTGTGTAGAAGTAGTAGTAGFAGGLVVFTSEFLDLGPLLEEALVVLRIRLLLLI